MHCGISKYAMLEMENVKVLQSEGIELPNEETIKLLNDEKGHKYLAVLQFDSVKNKEIKTMITKVYYTEESF